MYSEEIIEQSNLDFQEWDSKTKFYIYCYNDLSRNAFNEYIKYDVHK